MVKDIQSRIEIQQSEQSYFDRHPILNGDIIRVSDWGVGL